MIETGFFSWIQNPHCLIDIKFFLQNTDGCITESQWMLAWYITNKLVRMTTEEELVLLDQFIQFEQLLGEAFPVDAVRRVAIIKYVKSSRHKLVA